MSGVREIVLAQLRPLVGLRLAIARRAGSMRVFHFGPVRQLERGSIGEYALHIQCPWRIETRDSIVTGQEDLWEPFVVPDGFDWDAWTYETGDSLQDHRLASLLGGHDARTKSHVNNGELLVVESVEADDHGSASLALTGGFCLRIFPAGSRGEEWRLFRPSEGTGHFVVSGGGD